MPEPKTAPTEKANDRPVMNKRVERKEDGRTLIYYTFEKSDKNPKASQDEAAK